MGMKQMTNIRTYSEMACLKTFEARFEYLRLDGAVGRETFGFDRYLNQAFYNSAEWKRIRDIVILRDNGCDLGLEGYAIGGRVIIHHMNPVNVNDIRLATAILLNPEYLVCVSHSTHNAIHYGDAELALRDIPVERKPNDTCPWKH